MELSITTLLNKNTFKLSFGAMLLHSLLFIFPVDLSSQHNQGLLVEYYDGSNFEKLVATRTEKVIKKYWNNVPPVEGIDPQQCSIRWTGKLKTPVTGQYEFSAKVDDGIRIWIGDELVIDDWQLNDMGRFKGTIKLEKGAYYDLKIEYFNAMIEGEIEVLWKIPDPNKSWWNRMFDTDYKTIKAEYYYQPDNTEALALVETKKPKPPITKKKAEPNKNNESSKTKKTIAKKAQPSPVAFAPVEVETIAEAIKKYTPKNIEFDRAQSVILASSYDDLDQLAEFLNNKPSLSIIIKGHTDNVGNAEKNLELSQKRAYAIASYLVKKDVDAQRITAKGYGGSQPLFKSEGGVYHPQNRRVEFVISDTAVVVNQD